MPATPEANFCAQLAQSHRGQRLARAFLLLERNDFEKAESLVQLAEAFANPSPLKTVA